MIAPITLHGPRLILRPWRLPEDCAPLFELNGDPAVMRHFPKVLDRAESDAWAERLAAHGATHGWTFWPVEVPGVAPLAGVVGLLNVSFAAPFTPAVEIGWRFATRFQGRGYAAEAARLALDFGFGTLGLERIVAFTPHENEPSWRLMERLGMRRDADFGHPRVAPEHRLHVHRLYVLDRPR